MSEEYFLKNYKNNPKNLRSQPNYCNKAQRRYKLHPNDYYAIPKFKYLAYKQCLPGCVVKNRSEDTIATALAHKSTENVRLTNDIQCKAFDNGMTNLTPCSDKLKASGSFVENTKNSFDQGK